MNAPTQLGRYEIIRRLGKSMTDVYLAMDREQNRKVALKLIRRSGDAATSLMIEAERRGVEIQKELLHVDGRMIEIYEYGEMEGYFFVAMQYVEGRSLADVLASDHVVDANRAAVIALEICEQLAKFHSAQSTVVHGDIKPSNIHLGNNDTVRLLDFGIAKTLRAGADATGHSFGSPSYCSPERLSRCEVDQQSDLWALGTTLYEMLAGVPPYQAENTRKLESLIRSKRPPRALPATCPSGLRAIVSKALAPDAKQRYGSAVEFQTDLQCFLRREQTLAEREQRSKWSPNATVEAAREALRRITRTARRPPGRAVQVLGAVAYFALGVVLWLAGTLGWQAWQARASTAAAPIQRPAPPESLAQLYVATADGILESYRASPDPWLYEFDWQKAEICLERAIALGNRDDRTLGKLALSRGYATLERLSGAQYSDRAAAKLRLRARNEFMIAARKLPADSAPHLALARVYTYELTDPEKAMTEFSAAGRLGAQLGPREIEQQGDVYRIGAQQELASNRRKAISLAAKARGFYQRIPGFNEVDSHVRELNRIRASAPRKAKPQAKPQRLYRWR